jgi:hypothetical protein
MSDSDVAAEVRHHPAQATLQEVSDRLEPVLLEGEELQGRRGQGCDHQQEVKGGVGESSRQLVK